MAYGSLTKAFKKKSELRRNKKGIKCRNLGMSSMGVPIASGSIGVGNKTEKVIKVH